MSTHVKSEWESEDRYGYLPRFEIYHGYAKMFPNNCAVVERTGDGAPVGPCCFYLENGTTCCRHGKFKYDTTPKGDE